MPVAPWRAVEDEAGLALAIAAIGLPAVLKTTRLGYDGRGQAVVRTAAEAAAAFARLAPKPLILEAFVPFVAEVSAIAARGLDGTVAVYDAVENRHRDHILDLSFAPARLPQPVAAAAQRHAAAVAEALELVGVLALELFVLPDGRLLGNEIAPRPHNSGHWTMDACAAGQFEQHIRAVAGLPLARADPASRCRHAQPGRSRGLGAAGPTCWRRRISCRIWYGKAEARAGRKLGHANRLLPLGSSRRAWMRRRPGRVVTYLPSPAVAFSPHRCGNGLCLDAGARWVVLGSLNAAPSPLNFAMGLSDPTVCMNRGEIR